jgi:phage baseplate assembly protein W
MSIGQPSLFGQGLGFPPRVDADGRLTWSVGEDNVRQSIRLILLTEPGERLLREEFGCGLRRFLFEPNTVTTRQLIRDRIAQAIGRWEPRVLLDAVEVEADAESPSLVNVTIFFRLVATQALGRMSLSLQLEG